MGRRAVLVLGFLSGLAFLTAAVSAQGVIQTVAGSNWVFRGNGGSALSAPLGRMFGLAADPVATDGTIYAADADNNIVVKISRGIITVVAGNAIRDYSGDGGPATFAALNDPESVVKDSQGNLYIADRGNCVIRRVDANGLISTYAGNGICTFSGNNVLATQASLAFPGAVGLDSAGNLLIADTANHCIRRVSTNGVINTVAGTCGSSGSSGDGGLATGARLNRPFGVAGDRLGNVYIADTNNHRIRKVTPTGVITTLAGNGTADFGGDGGVATNAMLNYPYSPVPDSSGNVYIADQLNQRIRKITPDGKINTLATGFFVDYLFGLTLDPSGQLHVSLQYTKRVLKVDPSGAVEPIPEAGSGSYKYGGDGGAAISANFYIPEYVLPDSSGFLVADTSNFLVRRVDTNGRVSTYAGNGQNFYDANTRGTPTSVSLSQGVLGMAKDGVGNLYLAVFGMIRQIRPDGTTSIVAGILDRDTPLTYVQDGVAALGAPMEPRGVAVDAAGAIYVADYRNHRVRKFTVGGNVSTFAGSGVAGFAGDGGPATAARLNGPWGLSFDTAGNLYIAEYLGQVVRKVTPSGIISTVAGRGISFFDGDGGQATLAYLSYPHNAFPDAFGNLYIADSNNNRIRKVDASGVITTVAGNGDYAFRGDGGPATQASLAYPEAVVVDSAGNLYIADTDNDRVRVVFTAVPTVSASASSLTFSAVEGTPSATAQTVQLSSSLTGVAFTATTSASWIVLSQPGGRMPAALSVSANATQLTAGTYSGTITISAPAAVPSQLTIRLTLTVAAANPPKLAVTTNALTFQAVAQDPGVVSQSLNILNTGGGTLNWTLTAQTFGGGNWLTSSAASGAASPASPSIVQIRVNPVTLLRGSYSGSLTISGSGQTATVAVNLIVVPGQTLLLSQTGLTFTGVEGGGAVPSQTFGVLNIGRGTMSWTAQVAATTGCGWLSVAPASGSSVANSTTVPLVEVPINVTGLAAGQYTCQIRVSATGADNSPRLVTAVLNVLPRGSMLPAVVRPTGLIFVRPQNSSSPGSQIAKLATGSPGGLEARISSSTFDGASWLRTAQTAARVTPGSAADIVIQPSLGTLTQGQYFGTVDLKLLDTASGTYSSQTIEVLFVVTAQRSDFVTTQGRSDNVFEGCVPTLLYLKSRSLGNSISVPTGWPINLEAQVKDDCDNPVSNATTIASFSTAEPAVTLVHLGGGVYQGSWRPNGNSSQVAVTVQARAGALTGKVSTTVQGSAGASSVSAISSGGIVNAAGFQGGAVAPGSIVSVFGQNLAASTAAASNAPLPKSLGGMTLNIGGVNAPLYYSSSGQVNAQIPFETTAGTPQAYALVTRGNQNVFTDSETLTIIPAKPGIFTINAQGLGAVQIAGTATFAAPTNSVPGAQAQPVPRGQFIVIYCTGLGAVDNPPASGSAALSNPLSRTVTLPTVTIGGVNAPLTNGFSGLSPGYVGLYQVNVQVPAGVAAGSAVPLVVTMNGVASNTVTIAVQ